MANLQERRDKEGKLISYSIRVFRGRDPSTGKQLTPYSATWRVPEGWGEKRARKEAERQAVLFEKRCKEGQVADSRQTFAAYAEYVLAWKRSMGLKHLTELHYRQCLQRVLPLLGPMRIGDIRPQHLNKLYESLAQPEARVDNETAAPTPRLWKEVARRGLTSYVPGPDGGRISLSRLRKGQTVRPATAERIAKALGLPKTALFYPVREEKRLSGRTIMNCHALVAGILAQAEREMLIPFNPARRATPPKKEASAPNYYQPEEVGQILQALAGEPLKWRAAVHLLLVSGCRRGELLGLKWNKVDWDQGAVRIDCALLYARDRGIYEGSPKTRDSVRTIRLPEETMLLLAEYRRWQSQQRLLLGPQWKDSPYVFTGERGGPMHPSHLGNWLSRFQQRHQLPHLNPHAFRHTMTSLLLFRGVDSVSISHRLGHSSVATTTNVYGHVMEAAEERLSRRMEEILLEARGGRPAEEKQGS